MNSYVVIIRTSFNLSEDVLQSELESLFAEEQPAFTVSAVKRIKGLGERPESRQPGNSQTKTGDVK